MSIKFLLTTWCALLFYLPDLYPQGANVNLDKYWHYRERLKTEFMVVGDQPGMSQAAERRDTVSNTIFWSDNTIWLGWYTGMLALEYHLLSSSDYPQFDRGDTNALQTNLSELYYALTALRRLDERAESFFPPPCDSIPDVRNGFFIRDDVPADFYTHFAGMTSMRSESNSDSVYFKEMSQDQAYHVLMGLALVKKFIPDTLEINGMNLRQEAVDQALLIAAWIERSVWIIKNPVCQDKNVQRGADASLLSYGLNETVKFISDNAVNYDNSVTTLYSIIWGTLVSPTNPGYANVNNLHMAMVLGAMGKGWNDTTLSVLMNLAVSNKWYAYPLLCVALHDDTASLSYPAFRDTMNYWSEAMLDEAPAEGPYTLYPDTVSHGYSVNNRFIRPRSAHYIGYDWTANCRFNGLDYMMLHNLYYTVTPEKWPFATARSEIIPHMTKVFPNPGSRTVLVRNSVPENIDYSIEIHTATGQLIFKSAILNQGVQEIDIASFPPGIYLLSLIDSNKNRTHAKFVKE